MSSLSYKPLRKSFHLAHITDEEIRWKVKSRELSKKYFSDRKLPSPAKEGGLRATQLVPDAKGMVTNILFTVPGYYDQKNPEEIVDPLDKSHFTTLIAHLARHRRHYTVLCHASQVEEIQSWFKKEKIRDEDLTLSISVFNYSIWAQDAYVALSDNEGNAFLAESICFTRDHDMSVADDLAMQTSIRAIQSNLYFQGGNVLVTDDYALIGMDYVVENQGRAFLETREKVIEQFRVLFGKPVLAVGRNHLIVHRDRQYLGGGVFQPIFHIDMYITATGVRAENGKEVLFVASPRLAREILNEKETENDFDKYFDEVAEQLSQDFQVRRMPILPTQFRSKESEFPRHYYLSYNNALVENYAANGKEHRYVYLPTFAGDVERFKSERYLTDYYGDKKRYQLLDSAARKIWEELGFTVFLMDPLEDLAMSWGSVHCIVKTLGRSRA
jgi:hypothetical protein